MQLYLGQNHDLFLRWSILILISWHVIDDALRLMRGGLFRIEGRSFCASPCKQSITRVEENCRDKNYQHNNHTIGVPGMLFDMIHVAIIFVNFIHRSLTISIRPFHQFDFCKISSRPHRRRFYSLWGLVITADLSANRCACAIILLRMNELRSIMVVCCVRCKKTFDVSNIVSKNASRVSFNPLIYSWSVIPCYYII